MEQVIFIDTEFTKFVSPQLISIALVASTGEQFYAEVPFTYSDCTDFVKEIVIPLLSREPPPSHEELAWRLMDWFAVVRINTDVAIYFESDTDRMLFLKIFDFKPPSFISFRRVSSREINELLRHEFHVKNKLPEHHALNDARGLLYSFRKRPLTVPDDIRIPEE